MFCAACLTATGDIGASDQFDHPDLDRLIDDAQVAKQGGAALSPQFELWNGNDLDDSQLQPPPRAQLICGLADVRLAGGSWDLGDCRNLHLRDVKLNETDTEALANALQGNIWLLNLDLGNTGLGASGVRRIARAITPPHDSDVHTVLLSQNDMGDDGAIAVASMLRHNRRLLRVDLGTNGIGDAGASAIAQALERNAHAQLQMLGLSWNKLNDDGAAALAQMLRRSAAPALEMLFLAANKITEVGGVALLQALPHHRQIEIVDLDDNFVSQDTLTQMKRKLRNGQARKEEL